MLEQLSLLKERMEMSLDTLSIKYPISELIIESIEILIDMKANDEIIDSWLKIQKSYLREIEVELDRIENNIKN